MTDAKGASAPEIRTESNRVALANEAELMAEKAIKAMGLWQPDRDEAIENLCDAVLILSRLMRESGDG